MKGITSTLITSCLFLLLIVSFPNNAEACDCDIPKSAREGLEQSDAVFTGKVKSIKKTKIDGEAFNEAWIEVGEIWKGIKESQIVVYTSWSSCQFEFQEGEDYLLYSYQVSGNYYVTNCGRSNKLSGATMDIDQLGPGMEASVYVNLAFKYNKWNWIFVSFCIVLFAGGIATYLIRNNNKK